MTDTISFEDAAERIVLRALEDAVATALPEVWERRARQFEEARPRPGDYRGRASEADLRAQDRRIAETAQACRQAAAVARMGAPWWVARVVDEGLAGGVAA